MYKKKLTILTLTSLMILSPPLIAEEGGSYEVDEGQAAASSAEDWPQAAESATPEGDAMAAMEQRMRERDARYEDLKARAREVGVTLPEDPPWKSTGMGMRSDMAERMQRRQAMMSMSPQERMAARQSALEEEWAKHQAVIDGMSDEERAACHAMHRRHMGMFRRNLPQRSMMWEPGVGTGWNPGTMQPGYGYGPYPYTQQNFWEPTW
jgi:hypothetical protein